MPPDSNYSEVVTGLLACLPRIRAKKILDMSSSIAISMGAEIKDVAGIMRAAGMSEKTITDAAFQQAKAKVKGKK